MPVIGGTGTPTVSVQVPVPTPVQSKPKSPVNFGGEEAPQPPPAPGLTGVPPAPRPKRQLTGVILPFSPPPKQMKRLPVKRVRYSADQSTVSILLKQLMHPKNADHRQGRDNPLQDVRGPLADALQENGREKEAELLRREKQHVVVHEGKIVPGQFQQDVDDRERRLWTLNHEPTYREWIKQGAKPYEDDPLEDGFVARNRRLIDAARGVRRRTTRPIEEPALDLDPIDPTQMSRSTILPKKLSRLPVKVVRVV